MKKLRVLLLLALLSALGIALARPPLPYEERLVQLQLEQLWPEYAAELRDEPLELRALLVDYADDPLLATKARLALLRYPQMARPILQLYGAEPEFQHILRAYGENIVPPIHYFLSHDIRTLALIDQAGETWRALQEAAGRLQAALQARSPPPAAEAGSEGGLTAVERGWYAVLFIHDQGHNFLGQFVVRADGEVRWIQTERWLEAANALFLGGVRALETKHRLDQPIEAADWGWAAVDVALGVGVLKVLRMGRAGAVAGRPMSFSQRSLALSPALLRGSAVTARLARYGAPLALAYVALRHPSVLNSMLGRLAATLGLPVLPVQVLGWSLLLLPLLYLAQLLLRPLAALLAVLGATLLRLESFLGGGRQAA